MTIDAVAFMGIGTSITERPSHTTPHTLRLEVADYIAGLRISLLVRNASELAKFEKQIAKISGLVLFFWFSGNA